MFLTIGLKCNHGKTIVTNVCLTVFISRHILYISDNLYFIVFSKTKPVSNCILNFVWLLNRGKDNSITLISRPFNRSGRVNRFYFLQ